MTLSSESIDKLVDNIVHDVFHLISSEPRYTETIMNLLPGTITEVIGDTSPQLIGELGVKIMDRIGVTEDNNPYAEHNIWKTRYETLYRYVKQNYASEYVDGAEYGNMGSVYGDFNTSMELD